MKHQHSRLSKGGHFSDYNENMKKKKNFQTPTPNPNPSGPYVQEPQDLITKPFCL